MWHRHPHTESVKALAELLNERHQTGLSDAELAEALASLRLKIVATEEPAAVPVRDADDTVSGLVCLDRSDQCAGELTTMLDFRHVRCEEHWSKFLGSEGM